MAHSHSWCIEYQWIITTSIICGLKSLCCNGYIGYYQRIHINKISILGKEENLKNTRNGIKPIQERA